MARPEDCVLLTRVNQIAHETGLMKDGKSLECGYAGICNGLCCLLMNDPRTLFIPLARHPETVHPRSGLERFTSRLEKTVDIQSKMRAAHASQRSA